MKQNFVITSLQSWDMLIGGNAKNIALELSLHHRVLYVNQPTTQSEKKTHIQQVNENLWVLYPHFRPLPINKLPSGFFFNAANWYNNLRIFAQVNKAIEQLSFYHCIHFCDNDIYRSFYARELLHAELFIYYRRDNLHPMSYWSRHIKQMEPGIIRKSDLVMCNSAELTEYPSLYKDADKVFDIGQGVDLSLYQATEFHSIPDDCRTLTHPIVGYTGAILSTRLDATLLYNLADSRPQYTFLLVGPEDDVFRNHPLHTLPNVVFTGVRPMEQMPNYISVMDVCLNPQLVNELTIGNYPRKVDEYLAMGKPVVATSTRTMRDIFVAQTHLATNLDEWLAAIDKLVKEIGGKKLISERIAFAHAHGWEHCVRKICAIVENYLNKMTPQ
ncbi:MAG: glycosyltransferase [Prevotellaceae bacterium]|jgi:glycosyltransferase involved in cell wall biosynthesis|nr:glycosyltransferase [Prevotellaceae bacterium]